MVFIGVGHYREGNSVVYIVSARSEERAERMAKNDIRAKGWQSPDKFGLYPLSNLASTLDNDFAHYVTTVQ